MSIQEKWKFYIIISILTVVLTFGHWQGKNSNQNAIEKTNEFFPATFLPETVNIPDKTDLPSDFLIPDFPFQTQAPLVNWDELHDEACEEASIILVNYYLNDKNISAEEMDTQILKMVDWQMKNWGEHKDLTAAETLELAQNIYHLDGKIIADTNIDVLKQQIAAGHPVIVPTAGRLLGNPNFRSPGPVYHMVVAVGFNDKNIIVQDVGTKNGEHYAYNQKIFANAWHDWAGSGETIEQGARNMLVLSK